MNGVDIVLLALLAAALAAAVLFLRRKKKRGGGCCGAGCSCGCEGCPSAGSCARNKNK